MFTICPQSSQMFSFSFFQSMHCLIFIKMFVFFFLSSFFKLCSRVFKFLFFFSFFFFVFFPFSCHPLSFFSLSFSHCLVVLPLSFFLCLFPIVLLSSLSLSLSLSLNRSLTFFKPYICFFLSLP